MPVKLDSKWEPSKTRYKVEISQNYFATVEDTYTLEEVACCDVERDAEIICECLNAIEYIR